MYGHMQWFTHVQVRNAYSKRSSAYGLTVGNSSVESCTMNSKENIYSSDPTLLVQTGFFKKQDVLGCGPDSWFSCCPMPRLRSSLLIAGVATSVGAEVSGVSAGDGSGERALQG